MRHEVTRRVVGLSDFDNRLKTRGGVQHRGSELSNVTLNLS